MCDCHTKQRERVCKKVLFIIVIFELEPLMPFERKLTYYELYRLGIGTYLRRYIQKELASIFVSVDYSIFQNFVIRFNLPLPTLRNNKIRKDKRE